MLLEDMILKEGGFCILHKYTFVKKILIDPMSLFTLTCIGPFVLVL